MNGAVNNRACINKLFVHVGQKVEGFGLFRMDCAVAKALAFVRISAMKFFLAIVAYLGIGVVLCTGMYLGMAKGSWWFLAAGLIAYVVSFGKIGCLPKKSH